MVISQMTVLFILLAIGYLAGKIKILNAQADKFLTRLVLCVAIPGMILRTVMRGDNLDITGGDAVMFILMALLGFLISFIVALPAARALGGEKRDRGMYGYLTVFGNVSFMGFPVTYAIFGADSTFYVAIISIPFTLLAFSIGIIMISGKSGKFDPRILANPPLIASLLAILIFATGFNTPAVVADVANMLGNITSPAAMLIIGSTLSRIQLKDVFSQWRLYPVTVLKLLVIPALSWLVFRQIVTNELMLGVLVVLSGMPSAAMATMLAMEYEGNERIASSGIFLTTLLSIATIPLILFLFLM